MREDVTASKDRDSRRLAAALALALAVVTALVYREAFGFGFVNLDDQSYVYANPMVLGGLTARGVAWAFTTFHVGNWHPLTWLSHMLDVSMFGPAPGAQHLVSVAFHLANALLLLAFLQRATGALWPSAAVAALFALHPLAVESVAWIAERKTVLSTLFLLLTLHAWLGYVRRPTVARYATALGLFAVGLLSKPMLVTLPFALLLVDAWPLGRIGPIAPGEGVARTTLPQAITEKVPFLVLSAALCVATIVAQERGGSVQDLAAIPILARLANAVTSSVLYLVRAVWPVGLAAFYPHPYLVGPGTPGWTVIGAVAVLAAVSWVAIRQRRSRPWLAFGWAWYLGTLVPVIGIVQVGAQAQADRYTYVPLIGIFVATAWSADEWLRRATRLVRFTAAGAILCALAVLAARARDQAGTWRDSLTLHRHALSVTNRNYKAWAGVGEALLEQGRLDEAIAASRQALEYARTVPEASNTLGVAYGRQGRHELALAAFRDAVRASPTLAVSWYNLGTAYGTLGDHPQAVASFREAVRLDPLQAPAWANLAVAHAALGEPEQARGALRQLGALDPAAAARLRAALGVN